MDGDADALNGAALARRLALRERQLMALAHMSAALYTQTDPDALVRQILDESLEIAQADAGSVLLYDPDTDELEFRYVVGEAASKLTGVRIPAAKGICGRVFRNRVPEITDDASADKDHAPEIGRQVNYHTRNIVSVPLKPSPEECLGVLQVLNKRSGRFDEADMEVLEIIAAQASAILQHVELQQNRKLAEIVKMIGDISHDVKNMMTPVESGVKTLELLLDSAFDRYDALSAQCPPGLAESLHEVDDGFQALREFFPEVAVMVVEGAANVTARAREIADAIKGEVSKPSFEMLDLGQLIASVVRPLRLVAERQRTVVDVSGVRALPPAALDRKLMYNAIYNLINNAIPETREGTIFVRSRLEDEGTERATIVLEVEDTGRGMSEDVRLNLFTPRAKSTKPGGTGLGTRIVKNAIDAHDGTVTVESEVGKGSRFALRLPYRPTLPGLKDAGPEPAGGRH